MEKPTIECVDFTPRKGFVEYANNELGALKKLLPNNSAISAKISWIEGNFLLEAKISYPMKTINSQILLDSTRTVSSPRNWLNEGIDQMSAELRSQLEFAS